jgi:hypothetical protein
VEGKGDGKVGVWGAGGVRGLGRFREGDEVVDVEEEEEVATSMCGGGGRFEEGEGSSLARSRRKDWTRRI